MMVTKMPIITPAVYQVQSGMHLLKSEGKSRRGGPVEEERATHEQVSEELAERCVLPKTSPRDTASKPVSRKTI